MTRKTLFLQFDKESEAEEAEAEWNARLCARYFRQYVCSYAWMASVKELRKMEAAGVARG